MSLTEAGELLYQRAGELLRFADSAKLEVSQIGQRQVLRLGMTSTTVVPVMPLISDFSRRNPTVHFEVHDGSSFSSETDRDEYIKTRLRDDIAEEYANAHDDVYPDDDYVDAEVERRFNEQFGIATPESAAE